MQIENRTDRKIVLKYKTRLEFGWEERELCPNDVARFNDNVEKILVE